MTLPPKNIFYREVDSQRNAELSRMIDIEHIFEIWRKKNTWLYYGKLPVKAALPRVLLPSAINTFYYGNEIVNYLTLNNCGDLDPQKVANELFGNRLNKKVCGNYTTHVLTMLPQILSNGKTNCPITVHSLNLDTLKDNHHQIELCRQQGYGLSIFHNGGNHRFFSSLLLRGEDEYIDNCYYFDGAAENHNDSDLKLVYDSMRKLSEKEIYEIFMKFEYGIYLSYYNTMLIPTIFWPRDPDEYRKARVQGLYNDNIVAKNYKESLDNEKLYIENFDDILAYITDALTKTENQLLLHDNSSWINVYMQETEHGPDVVSQIKKLYHAIGTDKVQNASYRACIDLDHNKDFVRLFMSLCALFNLFIIRCEHKNIHYRIQREKYR